jgi:glutaminyl-peptide cyclotransferase
MRTSIFIFSSALILASCTGEKDNKKVAGIENTVAVPIFNADSAYSFVKKQVSYGPRVPNTESHQKTGDFLVQDLKRHGAVVIEQRF